MIDLAPGWYRIPGTSRLVFLCASCAVARDYWPADLMILPDQERDDCADCGDKVPLPGGDGAGSIPLGSAPS